MTEIRLLKKDKKMLLFTSIRSYELNLTAQCQRKMKDEIGVVFNYLNQLDLTKKK